MKITKAVITAAGRKQRSLPLQTLVDRDGAQKSVLRIIVEEALRAGVEEICVVVCPGDEAAYAEAVGDVNARLAFVPQAEPLGYGHAIYCARDFVGGQPFLHLVGDHLWVSRGGQGLRRSSWSRWPRPRRAPSRPCRPRARACCPTTARWAAAACRGGRTSTWSKM